MECVSNNTSIEIISPVAASLGHKNVWLIFMRNRRQTTCDYHIHCIPNEYLPDIGMAKWGCHMWNDFDRGIVWYTLHWDVCIGDISVY